MRQNLGSGSRIEGGVRINLSASSRIGFFGVTATSQPSGTAQASVASTAVVSVTNTTGTNNAAWGFTTSVTITNLCNAVNSCVTNVNALTVFTAGVWDALVTQLGLMKGNV